MKPLHRQALLWILVFEVVSMAIGYLTQPGVDGWYKTLARPPLVPPNFVFPIVWTILYALIAVAGCKLWNDRATAAGKKLFGIFAAYMAFNWSWSFVFFKLHALLGGALWIVALNILAYWLIASAWKNNRTAAQLMILPTLWTTFAAYLNIGYWLVN